MNPEEYIITRKRKKYKFAKFFNAANCFEIEQWERQPVDSIEIGAGTGFFSVELAKRNPDTSFVALDVKADRLQKGAYEALALGIDNIRFVRARADQVDQLAPARSVGSIWVTFPDPFPKQRSAGRRLTHPTFLAKYRELLSVRGSVYLKHDDHDFFCWSIEQIVEQQWHIRELTFDLHSSTLSDDYKILTTYEQRWLEEGRKTHFVAAS